MNKAKLPGLMIAAALMVLGATGARAADPACDAKAAPLRPLMQTHTLPPYPEVSVMTQEQGTSLLEVGIGTDGVPTDVQVVTSSGSLRLDEAARDHVKSVWRWAPPMKDCKPIAVRTRISIKWDLKDAPGGGAAPMSEIPPQLLGSMFTVLPVDAGDYPLSFRGVTDMKINMVMVVQADSGALDAAIVRSANTPDLDERALYLVKNFKWTPALLNGKMVGASHLLVFLWTPVGKQKPDPKVFRDLMIQYMKADQQAAGAPARN